MDSLSTHKQRVAEWARQHYPANAIPNFHPPSWYGGISLDDYRALPYCMVEARRRAELMLLVRSALIRYKASPEHIYLLTLHAAGILLCAVEAESREAPVRAPWEVTDLYRDEVEVAYGNLRRFLHRPPHAIRKRIAHLWHTATILGFEHAPEHYEDPPKVRPAPGATPAPIN